VPRDRGQLLTLTGVGDYVADAVRCFAFGDSVAIVDTNTVRVAGRYFGFEFGPESRRQRDVIDAVARLLAKRAPKDSNMALLDFAATICTAVRPGCEICPVARACAWRTTRDLKQEEPAF